ncbi:MAG: hypothetical protein WCL37_04115 [Chrysiogenales bacterium]
MDINKVVAQLKISSENLTYFLTRLARQGKIDLQPVKNNRFPVLYVLDKKRGRSRPPFYFGREEL